MWVTLNYMCWAILSLNFIWGLTRKIKKRVIDSMMISRLFYWLIVISQVVIGLRSFHRHPLLVGIGAIITLTIIALSETAYARKQEVNYTPRLLWFLVALSIISIGIQTTVNF
ncbi:YisL family protein [Lentilactobacillus raoultii]|uniref:YisL family protein n=1 Tax=Lentilactobacillus raoultii TaxID=1987503 RepID=A0ABW3PJL0_9LACO|nr:YisL family protein [Lentilactobacillus raoultii]